MAREPSFSIRHGFSRAKDITIWEDAPENLRSFVLQTAQSFGLDISSQHQVLCRVLHVPYQRYIGRRIWGEEEAVQELMNTCLWFKVYDIIEAFYASLARLDARFGTRDASAFADDINEFFTEEGIGWQIVSGQIVTRGTEAFETVVRTAISTLEGSERPTAAKHVHEALQALSRRPQADLPGAANHAIGALECVARDVTGDENATLGEILKHHRDLLPKPLDKALSQVWGYASNEVRHVREGREISREEAELLVGLSATVSTYLLRRLSW